MEGLELICFEMIAANGSARSFFMESLAAAKEGNFEEADRLMSEGEAMLGEGSSCPRQSLVSGGFW